MANYYCVDGPLAGQATELSGVVPTVAIVFEVVDFDQHPEDVPQHHYVVEASATDDEPGRLRFSTTTFPAPDLAGRALASSVDGSGHGPVTALA